MDILSNEKSERYSSDKSSSEKSERYPVVHVQGGSAIRRPLIVLAVCAVAAIGYRRGTSSSLPRAPSCWR